MSFKTGQPPAVSIHDRLKAHIDASERATKLAREAIQLTAPGKISRAQDVAQKVKDWHRKTRDLDPDKH